MIRTNTRIDPDWDEPVDTDEQPLLGACVAILLVLGLMALAFMVF